MPKVKMLQGFSGAVDGNFNPRAGDVIDVSDGCAADLIKRGRAVKVDGRKKAAKRSAPETASKRAPEAAMKPKAKPRDG